MKSLLALILLAASVALPAHANRVVLYERGDFRGFSVTLERDTPNLAYLGFENRASSLMVIRGTWEFCTEPYFRGRCITYRDGQYPSLGGNSNRISSARPVGGDSIGDRPVDKPGWSNAGDAEVELFAGQNFVAPLRSLRDIVPNFDPLGFNDRVASLIVRRGTWEFCTDANFRGTCRTYGPGRYGQLSYGEENRYSSARPVRSGWGAGGPGGGNWNNPGRVRIRIFEHINFGGRSIWLTDGIDNLQYQGFNDLASSVIVEGGTWTLCSDANRGGQCRDFRPGQYPALPFDLQDKLSSAYPR